MSYDILAFDPGATTDDDFEAWWDQQALWVEGHTYMDPGVSTSELQAFYQDLAVEFPNLNGPDALDIHQLDEHLLARHTGYSFGRHLVYGTGSWSLTGELAAAWERLGRRHSVGIAFVSDTPLRIVRP